MRDVLADLRAWWSAGLTVGMGTVVETWNSAPRSPGAAMLVGPNGVVVGSVSGGCVESAVYELARAVISTKVPHLQRYGVSDADAFSEGLTCGGTVDVFFEAIDLETFPQLDDVLADIEEQRPVAVVTIVDSPDPKRVGQRLIIRTDSITGSFGCARLDAAVREDATAMLADGVSGSLRYDVDAERRGRDITVFVAAHAPKPRMIVFGAIDFAAAVARMGSFLGYRVTVCDARATFATVERFSAADEVVVSWPHDYLAGTSVDERTVVCVLTHDPKFDVPLLELALRLPLQYVGAMGSRRTQDLRARELRSRGISETELRRLHAPIGLDIGGRTPEETAVSIAAEIIATRWRGSGQPLRSLSGRIHR